MPTTTVCNCTADSRCREANALWEAANAVYYSKGYDAWMDALGALRDHEAKNGR